MNDRIRELALQAKLRSPLLLQHWGKINALTDSEQEELENIEKFAQLIVKECAEVCKSRVGNSDYNTGRMHCASDLREHFGVES